MDRVVTVIVAIELILALGCATSSGASYRYGLEEVEAGDEETSPDSMSYEDQTVRIQWAPTSKRVAFTLENKTDEHLEIVWNDASFVGPSGTAQKVMHTGVKYTDRNKTQRPTTIPAEAKVEDAVIPNRNVSFSEPTEYTSAHWDVSPYLSSDTSAEQTFRVILPLKIDGDVERYSFRFSADQVDSVS